MRYRIKASIYKQQITTIDLLEKQICDKQTRKKA